MTAAVRRIPGSSQAFQQVLDEMKKKKVEVGWPTAAQYADGTQVAYVAAIQEMGSPAQGIPPRPFIRPAIAKNSDHWANVFVQGIKNSMDTGAPVENAFEQLGLLAAADVAREIQLVTSPGLAQSTIDARLRGRSNQTQTTTSDKPLIATGFMFDSVSHEVSDK